MLFSYINVVFLCSLLVDYALSGIIKNMNTKTQTGKKRFKVQTLSVYVSTTLVLILLGIMGLLMIAAKSLSDNIKKDFVVSVVIKNETKDNDILKIKKSFNQKAYVANTKYISKEMVLEEQKRELGTDPVEFLGFNPYEASIEISLKPEYAVADSLIKIEKQLLSYQGVSEVIYQKDLISAINSNIHRIGIALLILFMLLAIISWSLISNLVRLTIYSKRFLLHTMKLVGATWGFIRRPFIMRNFQIGFTSGVVANILVGSGLYLLAEREPAIITILPFESIAIVGIGIILFGVVITVLCAYLSVNRFLRMRGNDLYFI